MGFRSVYRVLQEVFPQVDSRALRAVAIEHSKDADTAVEVVLVEVIPYLSKRSTAPSSSNESERLLNSSKEAVVDANTTTWTNDALFADSARLDELVNVSPCYDANTGNDRVRGNIGKNELISFENCVESSVIAGPDMSSRVTSNSLINDSGANEDHDQVCGNRESEEIILLGKCQESSVKVVGSDQISHVTSTTFKQGLMYSNESMNGHLQADCENLNGSVDCNINTAIHSENPLEQSRIDGNPLEVNNSVQVAVPLLQECVTDAPKSSLQLVVVPNTVITEFKKLESSGSVDPDSKKDISTCEVVDREDDSTANTMVTRSGQIGSIDLLEDIIVDARSKKKTFLSAMDSVVSLMREVDLQEKTAEQAKENASHGGLDTLAMVEALKGHLQHAKEANDMHAGEIYGEKAILATEVRELQSRLLNLSDEKDKSLAILDEMRQTLEVRLTAAGKEIIAAEQQKLEKEESARKALFEQELFMEKVVQESEILKQEADENSKLQEFLMDRGRIVDVLQGEISVRCQDVKLLKEKFDERVPLDKFLSSSQTSCIVASSSSFLKSVALASELADSSETPKKTSTTPSVVDRVSSLSSSLESITAGWVPEPADSSDPLMKTSSVRFSIEDQLSSGMDRARDDPMAVLVDDEWEFFDNREFYV